MTVELYEKLIINISLLLSISLVINIFINKYKRFAVLRQIFLGILIGTIGLLLMKNAFNLAPGIFYDTRSVLISVSGLFLGIIPTAVAAGIIMIYRIFIGGPGVVPGVLTTLASAAVGLLWHYFRRDKILMNKSKVWIEYYRFGLITHLFMLTTVLAFPAELVWKVMSAIGLPVMIIYPIGSLFICLLIHEKYQSEKTSQILEISEARFRTMFERAPIGVSIADEYQLKYINPMLQTILGRAREELLVIDWRSISHPDDLQQDLERFEALKAGKISSYSMAKRYFRPDGSMIWTSIIVAALDAENPSKNGHICMVQDITNMVERNEQIKQSEENYKQLYLDYQDREQLMLSLLNSIPDLIFYKDTKGRYIGCNQAFESFVGKTEEEIIGRTDFELFDYVKASWFREADIQMLEQRQPRKNDELVDYPDGRKIYLETLKTPYFDPEGNVVGLIGVSRDISDRKQKENEILYLNYHDVLTGLYNRAYYDEEREQLDREENLPLSVIIGDINGLKLINDAFGHAAGDQLLEATANILRESCRPQDVIARTGGDEFCILLPLTADPETRKIVERIRKASEAFSIKSGSDLSFTSLSLGYATKTSMNESLEKVVKTAEEYMYRRKLLEDESLHSSIISSIKTTLFEKSNETEAHAERIALMSKQLGLALGLNEEELVSLELVSTLHDIGKISIDRNILTKPGKLSDEEWIEMKKHPGVGFRIAQTVPELRPIAEFILCHHERWDGKGYPQGLSGEDIPLQARILAIADSYDAMTQDRSYKKGISRTEAIQEIERNAGTQFDPHIARIFIERVLKNSTFPPA